MNSWLGPGGHIQPSPALFALFVVTIPAIVYFFANIPKLPSSVKRMALDIVAATLTGMGLFVVYLAATETGDDWLPAYFTGTITLWAIGVGGDIYVKEIRPGMSDE